MNRRVVITGMGAISCLGNTLPEITKSLQKGISGVGIDPERQQQHFRSPLTGVIRNFNPRDYGLARKQLKTMADNSQFAWAAVQQAIADSGLDIENQRHEIGIIFGNDSAAKPCFEAYDELKKYQDTTLLGSGYIFQAMNSTVTMNLSTLLGLRGVNFTMSAACASGAHAIGIAYLLIRQGLSEVVITGGAQELNWQAFAAFDALKAFSLRVDQPSAASRPFDRDRDGLVPSGGAASLILEPYERAKARGAKIYGEIVGYAFSGDGDHLSSPSGEGAKIALRKALEFAQLNPEQIDYVNAHATSTPEGDRAEARAIAEILGSQVSVSSTKSLTGHECWMAGASEAVYSLLMMQENFIAPNLNFERQEPEAPKINIGNKTLSKKLKTVLSNSFGFGGTNAVLILKKV